jgi:serine/threonine protein kinase
MFIDSLAGPEHAKQYINLVYLTKGGMGEIYLADDTVKDCTVAIKLIPLDAPEDAKLIRAEASIVLALDHPNIIKTFYYGETTLWGTDWAYFSMEYLKKGNLHEFLKASPNLDLARCMEFMVQITEGLKYAHASIVHRDIKPQNILVDDTLSVKICDFGLAKYVNNLTRSQSLKGSGTYPYMSPEGWTSASNTPSMDIYSSGIVFYQVLSGRLPFVGRSEKEYRDLHLFEPLPDIRRIRADVPLKLAQVISKMANKNVNERYASMSEVLDILKSLSMNLKTGGTSLDLDPLLLQQRDHLEKTKQLQLQADMAATQAADAKKIIESSKKQVIQRFVSRAVFLNENTEEGHIRIDDGGAYAHLYLGQKSITISFGSQEETQAFIRDRRQRSNDHQEREFGFPLINPAIRLERERVVLIGRASESGGMHVSKRWGFNLVLRKRDEDLYGSWYVVYFDESNSMIMQSGPKSDHYSLATNEFNDAYEKAFNNTFGEPAATTEPLADSHIDELIGRLLLT